MRISFLCKGSFFESVDGLGEGGEEVVGGGYFDALLLKGLADVGVKIL